MVNLCQGCFQRKLSSGVNMKYRIVSRAEVRIEVELFGPNSICRVNAHMVYGLKHQHFTLHSITLFVLNISATRPCVANAT